MTAVVAPASVRVIVTFCLMTSSSVREMLQKSHFVALLSSESVGDVDHTRRIAEQPAVLFFGDREVYRPDTAATLSRSSLGSFAVDGHRGNYTFQPEVEPGEYLFHSLQVWAPTLGAQRYSMKLGIRILLHRSRPQQ